MALFDDILSGGNWVTGLAIGVGAVIILALAAPILRPLAKTAIKGGILAFRGGAGLVEGIGDLVAEIARRRLEVAVVIVSGYAEAEEIAVDLPRITKPFRLDDLATVIRAALCAPAQHA